MFKYRKFPNIIDPSVKVENNVEFGLAILSIRLVLIRTKIKNFCVLTYLNILAHNVTINSFSTLGSRLSFKQCINWKRGVYRANALIAENILLKIIQQ